jgi:hypothetical protein
MAVILEQVRELVYGGGMRTVLARQERMGPQGVGWPFLFRQISIAVR